MYTRCSPKFGEFKQCTRSGCLPFHRLVGLAVCFVNHCTKRASSWGVVFLSALSVVLCLSDLAHFLFYNWSDAFQGAENQRQILFQSFKKKKKEETWGNPPNAKGCLLVIKPWAKARFLVVQTLQGRPIVCQRWWAFQTTVRELSTMAAPVKPSKASFIMGKRLGAGIRCRPPDKRKNNWFLRHDNAPTHTSLLVRQFLTYKKKYSDSPPSLFARPCPLRLFSFIPKVETTERASF